MNFFDQNSAPTISYRNFDQICIQVESKSSVHFSHPNPETLYNPEFFSWIIEVFQFRPTKMNIGFRFYMSEYIAIAI